MKLDRLLGITMELLTKKRVTATSAEPRSSRILQKGCTTVFEHCPFGSLLPSSVRSLRTVCVMRSALSLPLAQGLRWASARKGSLIQVMEV